MFSLLAQEADQYAMYGWISFIVMGIISGWLAGQLWKGSGFGVVGDMIIGILGALLGGFLFNQTGVMTGPTNLLGGIVVATIGALVLLFLIHLVRGGSTTTNR